MDGFPSEPFEFEGLVPAPEEAQKRFAFKSIHKRVVCRYWLNNACKKGDTCEFLHAFDHSKMPECRKGAACGDPSCFLTHPSKDDKPICPNYAAGFCSFGHSCNLRHLTLEGPPPSIAEQFLVSDPAKAWIASRRKTQKSFRKAECPYFHNDGWCPYFLTCAFSHVRIPPKPVFSEKDFPPLAQNPAMVHNPAIVQNPATPHNPVMVQNSTKHVLPAVHAKRSFQETTVTRILQRPKDARNELPQHSESFKRMKTDFSKPWGDMI